MEALIDEDAATRIELDARVCQPPGVRRHADSDHHAVGFVAPLVRPHRRDIAFGIGFERLDLVLEMNLDAVLCHAVGDPPRFPAVERDRPKPLAADEEMRPKPCRNGDLDRFDTDQASPDHGRLLGESPAALGGDLAKTVWRVGGAPVRVQTRPRRPTGPGRPAVYLTLVPVEVLQRHEVPDPPRVASRPRALAWLRARCDQQAVVCQRLLVAHERDPPLRCVDGCGARPHPPEAEPLIRVALERLDVAMAHLSGEHPHQRRPGEEVVALLRDEGDLPVGLASAHR